MSTSLAIRPKRPPPPPVAPGTHMGNVVQSTRHKETTTMDDGSLVISEEQLRRFGNGDGLVGRRELRLLLEIDTDLHNIDPAPSERPKSVRIAGPADEPALLELWLHDLRANAEHIAPIDEDKVLENIQMGTRQRGYGHVGVIDGPGGKPVAMVVLHLRDWHWSKGYFWQEMVSYVHPDHRRSRHADDLLVFCKWVAEDTSRGAGFRVPLLCGVLGAWRTRAKIALYRRKFPQVGAVFIWPPPARVGN